MKFLRERAICFKVNMKYKNFPHLLSWILIHVFIIIIIIVND